MPATEFAFPIPVMLRSPDTGRSSLLSEEGNFFSAVCAMHTPIVPTAHEKARHEGGQLHRRQTSAPNQRRRDQQFEFML
jgi:hypothetical protein